MHDGEKAGAELWGRREEGIASTHRPLACSVVLSRCNTFHLVERLRVLLGRYT